MKKCPITGHPLTESHKWYSQEGLHMLDRQLKELQLLPLTAQELLEESARRTTKMSIQGVQPKLSAQLSVKRQAFKIVDSRGSWILKPQHPTFPELPENEDVTMRLAQTVGIETPMHCLIYAKDHSLVYAIRRFDRFGRGKKRSLEDFAQLTGKTRDTKYDASIEQVAKVIDTYSTFPLLDKERLWLQVLFSFLVGNEDMHLKNYSLIGDGETYRLSPAYDLVNSTLVLRNPPEESALPINAKKRRLTRKDLVTYLGTDRLGLNNRIIETILERIQAALPSWPSIIERSFLSEPKKVQFWAIVEARTKRLGLAVNF